MYALRDQRLAEMLVFFLDNSICFQNKKNISPPGYTHIKPWWCRFTRHQKISYLKFYLQKIYTILIGLENTKYPSYMKWDIQTAIILLCILVALALGSPAHTHDATKPTNESNAQCSNGSSTVESNEATQGPADWESIGHVLGCVFAPQSCKSKK